MNIISNSLNSKFHNKPQTLVIRRTLEKTVKLLHVIVQIFNIFQLCIANIDNIVYE